MLKNIQNVIVYGHSIVEQNKDKLLNNELLKSDQTSTMAKLDRVVDEAMKIFKHPPFQLDTAMAVFYLFVLPIQHWQLQWRL